MNKFSYLTEHDIIVYSQTVLEQTEMTVHSMIMVLTLDQALHQLYPDLYLWYMDLSQQLLQSEIHKAADTDTICLSVRLSPSLNVSLSPNLCVCVCVCVCVCINHADMHTKRYVAPAHVHKQNEGK